VEALQAARSGVLWVEDMLPRTDIVQLLTHATVFACPSVYEPLGIVNLEAMACETAVVASDVGGIPEVVVDGETGLLVHYEEAEPKGFQAGLAEAVNELVADPDRTRAMGKAGRVRAVEQFAWSSVAEQTLAVYRKVL
jgi:starch synthase